jgi:hypothetical protein
MAAQAYKQLGYTKVQVTTFQPQAEAHLQVIRLSMMLMEHELDRRLTMFTR